MSDPARITESTDNQTTVTVFEVPDEFAEQVKSLIASLQPEADVTGYAFGTGGMGGRLLGTGCITTGLITGHYDTSCADSDRF